MYKRTLFFSSYLNEELSLHLLHSWLQPTSVPSTPSWKSAARAINHRSPDRWSSVFLTPAPAPSPVLPSRCFRHTEAVSGYLGGRSVYLQERFVSESTKELTEPCINKEFRLHRSSSLLSIDSSRAGHGHLFLKSFTSHSTVNWRWRFSGTAQSQGFNFCFWVLKFPHLHLQLELFSVIYSNSLCISSLGNTILYSHQAHLLITQHLLSKTDLFPVFSASITTIPIQII